MSHRARVVSTIRHNVETVNPDFRKITAHNVAPFPDTEKRDRNVNNRRESEKQRYNLS